MLRYNVWELIRTAVNSGIVEGTDAKKLVGFAELLESVREQALCEAAKICTTIASASHVQMWEYKTHGMASCAELEKARVDTAELIQRTIRTRMSHETRQLSQDQGGQAEAAAALGAGRAEAGTQCGACQPEADAACTAAPEGQVGGQHG